MKEICKVMTKTVSSLLFALLGSVAWCETQADAQWVLRGNGTAPGAIDTGLSIDSSVFTVEAWVCPEDLSAEQIVLGQFKGGTDGDFTMRILQKGSDPGGKVQFFYRNFATIPSSTEMICANSWSHLALVTDGDTTKVYINGNLSATSERTAAARIKPPQASRLFLAGHQANSCFRGKLREIRYWSVARTAEEIRDNRFKELDGVVGGLVARWPMNQKEGTTLYESVSASSTAVLTANVAWMEDTLNPFVKADRNIDWVYQSAGGASGGELYSGYSINTTAFTLETWFRPSDTSSGHEDIVFGQVAGGTTGDLGLRVYNQGTVMFFYRGFATLPDAGKIPVDAWSHLALVTDGDTAKVFINGRLNKSFTRTATDRIVPPQSAKLFVGGQKIGNACTGRLREARYWSVARTDAEIRDSYRRKLSGAEPGLVGCWPLDCVAGGVAENLADAANPMTLSIGGSWVRDRDQPFRSIRSIDAWHSYSFPGGVDPLVRAKTGLYLTTTNFTWEAWVRPSTLFADESSKENRIMGAWAYGNSHGIVLQFSQGRLVAKLRKYANSGIASSVVPRVNRWQHVALTSNGLTAKIYLNGELCGEMKKEDSDFKAEDGLYAPCPTSEFTIGANLSGSTDDCFHGRMSDVRVWFKTRTSEEIVADMNRRLTGEESGLVGYWPLDEGLGTAIENCLSPVGENSSATLADGAWFQEKVPFPFTRATGFRVIIR